MVAGGAGGGKRDNAGGGGAGQYVEGSTTCPTSPVTVTIGAGGAHGQPSSKGSDGGYTRLTGALTVSATAGGGGGYAGEPGGSGGGGGYQSEPGGNASPGVGGYLVDPVHLVQVLLMVQVVVAVPAVLELMAPMLKAGNGGLGRQVPAIFRDPNSRVGHPGTKNIDSCQSYKLMKLSIRKTPVQ